MSSDKKQKAHQVAEGGIILVYKHMYTLVYLHPF